MQSIHNAFSQDRHFNLTDLTYGVIRANRMRKTIKCPTCGTRFPLPSRWGNPRSKVLRVGDLVLNPATYDATRAGKEIALSRTQVRLLETLMRRSGQVVPRNALVHTVWYSDNLIDAFIYQLRKKVDRDHKVKLIKTVPNLGYVIRDPAKAR